MPAIDGGDQMSEEYSGHRFKEKPADVVTKPQSGLGKLDLEIGRAYSDGHKTVIIVAKLQHKVNDLYEYVGNTGGLYTSTGVGYNVPSLLIKWPMAESLYCDPNDRGFTLLHEKGGEWLGHVHGWIQRAALNGDRVTWGSQEYLNFRGLTVHDLEMLAANCAAAAIREYANSHYLLRAIKKAES